MTKLRMVFWSAIADLVHGIRYALVPALDLAWRKRDALIFDLEMKRDGRS